MAISKHFSPKWLNCKKMEAVVRIWIKSLISILLKDSCIVHWLGGVRYKAHYGAINWEDNTDELPWQKHLKLLTCQTYDSQLLNSHSQLMCFSDISEKFQCFTGETNSSWFLMIGRPNFQLLLFPGIYFKHLNKMFQII